MKSILDFLTELEGNNSREWMEQNKSSYLAAKNTFEEMVKLLIDRITTFDQSLVGVRPKDCIFRLHRDVRFSHNKLPYKTNMGAFIGSRGKKTENGGYYIHIEPGKSMLAGGVYMPPSDILKKIRQEIDYNPGKLIKYMESKQFKQYFGSFAGETLKTTPKGYAADHPHIDLLRLKSYIVVHNITDDVVLKPGFINFASEVFSHIKPLNDYILLATNE